MADAARKKPFLQVVREGNPGKRPLDPGLILAAAKDLSEPNWQDTFPTVRSDKEQQDVNRRAREVARREWRRVVPVLQYTAGLAEVDVNLLHDYCVVVSRIDQCERDISTRGLLVPGERGGWVKNGAATVVSQYRAQLKVYIRELGLSPSARASFVAPEGDNDGDDGDPFD
jgi:P27 family predicted phage terminase small subunit